MNEEIFFCDLSKDTQAIILEYYGIKKETELSKHHSFYKRIMSAVPLFIVSLPIT